MAGEVAKIDTRVPPDDMHEVSFRDVLGERPVALLFATPALCASRTCGPVTDLATQLEHTYGERMTFIHQEVYVDTSPARATGRSSERSTCERSRGCSRSTARVASPHGWRAHSASGHSVEPYERRFTEPCGAFRQPLRPLAKVSPCDYYTA